MQDDSLDVQASGMEVEDRERESLKDNCLMVNFWNGQVELKGLSPHCVTLSIASSAVVPLVVQRISDILVGMIL